MSEPTKNVAETVAALMRSSLQAEIFAAGRVDREADQPLLAVVPEGQKVVDLTAQLRTAQSLLKPFLRSGTARLTTVESLIAWANRNKDEDSVIFADNHQEKPTLTCIADYNHAGPTDITPRGDKTARHGKHRAVYAFPLSAAWKDWMKVSGTPMSSVEMGVFLEDHILDVIDPPLSLITPGLRGEEATDAELRLIDIARRLEGNYGSSAQLLGMAKTFTVNETADYSASQNLQTGEFTVAVKSEHRDEAGNPVKVPKLFLIAIPVFEGGPVYRLPVRFQYRKAGTTLKFVLTIHDPKAVSDDAFNEAAAKAAELTGLPVLMGTPET